MAKHMHLDSMPELLEDCVSVHSDLGLPMTPRCASADETMPRDSRGARPSLSDWYIDGAAQDHNPVDILSPAQSKRNGEIHLQTPSPKRGKNREGVECQNFCIGNREVLSSVVAQEEFRGTVQSICDEYITAQISHVLHVIREEQKNICLQLCGMEQKLELDLLRSLKLKADVAEVPTMDQFTGLLNSIEEKVDSMLQHEEVVAALAAQVYDLSSRAEPMQSAPSALASARLDELTAQLRSEIISSEARAEQQLLSLQDEVRKLRQEMPSLGERWPGRELAPVCGDALSDTRSSVGSIATSVADSLAASTTSLSMEEKSSFRRRRRQAHNGFRDWSNKQVNVVNKLATHVENYGTQECS